MYLAVVAQSVALAISLGTGLAVLLCNVRRGLNQAFAAFCLTQAAWMACIMVLTVTLSEVLAYWFIVAATVAAAAMPVSFNAVRLAVLYPELNLVQLLRPNRYLVGLLVAVSVLCFTPLFLQSVVMPPVPNPEGAIIEPVYGVGFPIFAAYLLLSFAILIALTVRNAIQLRGLAKNEMQILLLGLFACVFVGCTLGLIPPLVFGTSAGSPWTPSCIMLINLFVAYGIATHRIMGVHTVLRRMVAYALLGLYFLVIFTAFFLAADWALPVLGMEGDFAPALVTAMATAWLFAWSSRSVKSFTNRLFVRFAEVELAELVRRSEAVLGLVTETPSLLKQYRAFLLRELGTEHVSYVFFDESYQDLQEVDAVRFESISGEARQFLDGHPCIHLGLIRRQRSLEVPREFTELDAEAQVMLAIRDSKGRPVGLTLVGGRLSGRIFTSAETQALESLSHQFSRAFNNARLFTRIEQSRDYIQTLINSLPIGVFAIDGAGRIDFANEEATRLLGGAGKLEGEAVANLPAPVRAVVGRCLKGGRLLETAEGELEREGESIPVRLAARRLDANASQEEAVAIAYCEDLSEVKTLERQLMRADRLSNLGRLSASIAHEVKNPLTAIKTFAQLVPERLDDSEFLGEFTRIVDEEVAKIDATVRQLLDFARSSDSRVTETDVHAAIRGVARLLKAELSLVGMRLEVALPEAPALILADQRKLEQVLLNLVLNAKEAEGERTATKVRISTSRPDQPRFSKYAALSKDFLATEESICVTVEDNGPGFPPHALESAFEPFFTTKERGTGLGLAIVFGIVGDLGGVIDIGNHDRGGAWVRVYLPAIKVEELAA